MRATSCRVASCAATASAKRSSATSAATRSSRASIAGKLATVQSLFLAAAGFVVVKAMDWNPENYHYLFPLLALLGLVGNQIYRKVRLRRARQLQREVGLDIVPLAPRALPTHSQVRRCGSSPRPSCGVRA